jgi:hypothetical protein
VGAVDGPAAIVEVDGPAGCESSVLSFDCSGFDVVGIDGREGDEVDAGEDFFSASMAYVKASTAKSGFDRTA